VRRASRAGGDAAHVTIQFIGTQLMPWAARARTVRVPRVALRQPPPQQLDAAPRRTSIITVV